MGIVSQKATPAAPGFVPAEEKTAEQILYEEALFLIEKS